MNFVSFGRGTPVIMIHGLAASLHDWDFLMPAMANSGYAGFALDLLGHGESGKPARVDAYNMDFVFDHMAAWIDSLALSEIPVLISHSLGGYLALQYALQYPRRVQALVLANPFYHSKQLSSVMQLISRHQLVNTALIEHTPYWMFRALVDLSSLSFNLGGERNGHTLSESVRAQTALDYKRSAPGIFNLPRTLCDLTPELPHVTQPTLVLWGQQDRTLYPDSFPDLVARIPNAQGKAIPSCGHVPHQCHAAQFNRLVLNFLTDLQ